MFKLDLSRTHSAKTRRALPPSVIIDEACKKSRNCPPALQPFAEKCCLTEEQVHMWWDHLRQNAMNKARRALGKGSKFLTIRHNSFSVDLVKHVQCSQKDT